MKLKKIFTLKNVTIASMILFTNVNVFKSDLEIKNDLEIINNNNNIAIKRQYKKLQELNHFYLIKKKILYLSPNISNNELNKISKLLCEIDDKNSVITSDLLISLIYVESRFKKYAKSSAGAVGYCQIMPSIHKVPKNKMYNTEFQIRFSYNYLMTIYKFYTPNKLDKALNYYNGRVCNNNYANKVFTVKNEISKLR